jgi:hypothetical protein
MRPDIRSALACGVCIFAGIAAIGGFGDAESPRQIVRVLVASGFAGLIGGVLLFILDPLEKRVDRTAPRHRRLRRVYIIMFVVWMFLHGPLRTWAGAIGFGDSWALGVAPSFFAGLAVAIASALAYGFRPLIASAYGAGFSIFAEMIQPWLPSYTFDPWDVAAGLVGACFAVPLLMRWPVPVHTENSPALRTEGD